jgi:oligopeptide transport system substrate-binding protein
MKKEKTMKKFSRNFLSAFLILCCFSCQKTSQQGEKKEKTFRLNLGAEPQSLHPAKARTLSAIGVVHMLFDGLTRISPEGKPEMSIAEKVEVSSDQKTYVFHLKKTFWSTGKELTAFDFVYAWKNILDPKTPSPLAYYFYDIHGAKLAKEGKGSLEEVGIEASDAYTIKIQLDYPVPYFLELMACPVFSPINPEIDQKNFHWSEESENYVSNGPFIIKKWEHNNFIELEKNKTYWDQSSVKLQKIVLYMVAKDTELQMYENNEIDWAGSPFSTLPTDALQTLKTQNELHIAPYLGTSFLRINQKDPFLSSQKLRKALYHAVDRKAIVEHVLQGGQIAAFGLLPPCMSISTKKEEEDFLTNFSNGEKIVLTYLQGDRNHILAQALQRQWEEILGIDIALESVESTYFYERVLKGQYQISLGSWIADFNDPSNFLEVFHYKDNGTNNTFWENSNYIELLNQAKACENAEERENLFTQAQNILIEEKPIIPLYHLTLNFLQKPYVQNVYISPLGHLDLKWADIQER